LANQAWVWHEAADVRHFHPLPRSFHEDLVWIGNWGDGERSNELSEFVLEPVRQSKLRAAAYGVRYPEHAIAALREAGLEYRGWLPNYSVPEAFAKSRMTVHVPRRIYTHDLPGIPTIRVFEALACGIPLLTAPWTDSEGLFKAGIDFLVARTGKEMSEQARMVMNDFSAASEIAKNGLAAIAARHTCAHRVDELLEYYHRVVTPNPDKAHSDL
jgi:spore maturation protein CgeB